MIWPRAALSSAQKCAIQTEMLHFPTKPQNQRCVCTKMRQVGTRNGEWVCQEISDEAQVKMHTDKIFCCIFGVAAGVKGKPTRWEWTCCRVSFGDDDTDKETGGPAEDIKIHTGSEQDGRDLKWIWWSSSSMQKKRRFRGQMFGATGEQTTERERWRQLICCRDQRRHGRKTCSNLSVYLTPKFPLPSSDMSALLLCLATCHSPHHPSIHP